MPSRSMGLTSLTRARNPLRRAGWFLLRALPVTLAVVAGPPIAIAYRLTRPEDTASVSFSVPQAARGLLCLLMFLSLLASTGSSLPKHRFIRPLLFLAAYALVTSSVGPYPYEHLVFAMKMAFIVLVFASAFQLAADGLFSERWLTTSAWVVLLTMAACIGGGLALGRTIDAHASWYATAGFTGHPATASRLILSTLPVFVSLTPHSGSALAGIVILFTSLFFTMRRSSLIAGVVALGVSSLVNLICRRRRALWRRTMVPFVVLILSAGIGLSTTAGNDLIKRFNNLNPFGGSGSGRYIFWPISLEHIINRPVRAQIVGEGMGSIRDLLGQRFGVRIGSHNDWLDLVHAFGWAGLIGIGWWYFELARFTWHLRTWQNGPLQGACACALAIGLISMGSGGFFDPSWALSYAAMGFWAGYTTKEREPCETGCPVY
jgi:hypothetical protein